MDALAIGLLGLAFLLAWLVLTPGAGAAQERATPTKFTVRIATTPLGKIVVDAKGRSLYLFEADRKGKSACYGACAKAWPPVIVRAKPTAGPGARAKLLGMVRRKDGKEQATYRGHPLYRFYMDTKRGQVKGQGLDFFGGEWYVLTSAGKKLEREPSRDDDGTTDDSGGTITPGGGYGGGYG
jgi:predicted lipoprotein with Yx(FWY)xxD motif